MKSIRVSLIVYFLALLLLGLGGVSLLAYRTTAATLRDKEVSGKHYLETEFQTRDHDLHDELDDQIRKKLTFVSKRINQPSGWRRFYNIFPLHGTPAVPLGYFHLSVDVALGVPWPRNNMMPSQFRYPEPRVLDQLVIHNDEWGTDEDGHPWEGCQTFWANGELRDRTSNLAIQPFSLDKHFRQTADLMEERWDDVPRGNMTLRRLSLKVPRPKGPPPPKGGGGFGGPSLPKEVWRAMTEQHFYIQYAVDTSPLAKRLAHLRDDQDRRIAKLSEETQTTLHELRQRLFFLCGLTAISVLVGGFVLFWIGLAPLHRLSDAVSRINEKDFELKIDPQSLPSELKPVAQRLSHALDQLRKAFAREKQAAQDISHDLRTPLAALTTTIEVALKKERTTAEYRELIQECQISAEQMSHLVERLLALAKIDSGSNPARLRPLDLVQVANNAADLVRPLAKARGIALAVHAPAELPMLADSDKLGDVLTNLLHNAVDYNRDGGAIDLFIEHVEQMVAIRVVDTGIGIRPEARERLFERFYRADPSRHTETPHCGLGLAIVKSYVDLMGGTITVDSQLGTGTTFTIRFPHVGPADSGASIHESDSQEVLV